MPKIECPMDNNFYKYVCGSSPKYTFDFNHDDDDIDYNYAIQEAKKYELHVEPLLRSNEEVNEWIHKNNYPDHNPNFPGLFYDPNPMIIPECKFNCHRSNWKNCNCSHPRETERDLKFKLGLKDDKKIAILHFDCPLVKKYHKFGQTKNRDPFHTCRKIHRDEKTWNYEERFDKICEFIHPTETWEYWSQRTGLYYNQEKACRFGDGCPQIFYIGPGKIGNK